MADWPAVAAPEVTVPAEFAGLASAERIAAAAAALQQNGISSHITRSRAEARRLVGSLLPDGAEVYNNTSQTRTRRHGPTPVEVTTDQAPVYPRLIDEPAWPRDMSVRSTRTTGWRLTTADSRPGCGRCAESKRSAHCTGSQPTMRVCRHLRRGPRNSPSTHPPTIGSGSRSPISRATHKPRRAWPGRNAAADRSTHQHLIIYCAVELLAEN